MIENERQRQAVLGRIKYWKDSASAGDQSWLAGEQALEEMMQLHQMVEEYDKRTASSSITRP